MHVRNLPDLQQKIREMVLSKNPPNFVSPGRGRGEALTPGIKYSVGGAVGGGGLAGRVQPGVFEQGRGDLWQASRELKWQIFLASKFGGLFSRVNPAGCHGKIFWRVSLAHLFGGSLWGIYLAGFHSQWNRQTPKLQREGKKRKGMYNQWICKLHHEHCMYSQ